MARSSEPPRLRLRLFERLQTLLLVNAIPLLGGLGIALLWWQGRIGIDMGQGELAVGILALLAIASMFFVGWCMLPVLNWMRAYTLWQCRHGSLVAWAIPCASAWLLWAAGLLLGLLICFAMLIALGTAAWRSIDPPAAGSSSAAAEQKPM